MNIKQRIGLSRTIAVIAATAVQTGIGDGDDTGAPGSQRLLRPLGGGWGWRQCGRLPGDFGTSTTTEQTYKVGRLVLVLFDTNTKNLIWRGSASDTLSDKSDKNIKRLNADMYRMFERFPTEVKK